MRAAGVLLQSNFHLQRLTGMVYSPLNGEWRLSTDTAVNYIGSFGRQAPP